MPADRMSCCPEEFLGNSFTLSYTCTRVAVAVAAAVVVVLLLLLVALLLATSVLAVPGYPGTRVPGYPGVTARFQLRTLLSTLPGSSAQRKKVAAADAHSPCT
eukprot:3670819-Rhodomonas_salina.1